MQIPIIFGKKIIANGSLQLNFENVLDKAQNAELWIGSGNFDTKKQMLGTHKGYAFFNAYKNNHVYTYTKRKGAKGGLLYYELGSFATRFNFKRCYKNCAPGIIT